MKFKDYLAASGDATEGERALLRIADALEAGEKPSDADADRLIDAAELIRAMIRDKKPIETRREAFTRKLGMTKPPHRTKRTVTAGEVLKGQYQPSHRAQAYWLGRANGAGHNEAIRQAMAATHKSRSTIKRAIKAHPEARETVLVTYQELARKHRAENGVDEPELIEAINTLGP